MKFSCFIIACKIIIFDLNGISFSFNLNKTPLILAIQNENLDIVKLLLQNKNIDINIKVYPMKYEKKLGFGEDVLIYLFLLYLNFFFNSTLFTYVFRIRNIEIMKYIMSYLKLDQFVILIYFINFIGFQIFFE